MSNMINDQIIDIISDVADMDKVQVMNALSPANLKKSAAFTGGGCIVDFARDILIGKLWDDVVDAAAPTDNIGEK